MAYNQEFLDKIKQFFDSRGVEYEAKKMFSGVCIMVNDKMCCGTHIDKQSNESLLMCRFSEDEVGKALDLSYCKPMMFTGKPMKDYIFILEEGIDSNNNLDFWLEKCLNFNPQAKQSKKTKKK